MSITTIQEYNIATQEWYWVQLDSAASKVKIITGTKADADGLTDYHVGPWLSEAEAVEHIKDVFSGP
jgi:hypothetical protein